MILVLLLLLGFMVINDALEGAIYLLVAYVAISLLSAVVGFLIGTVFAALALVALLGAILIGVAGTHFDLCLDLQGR